MLSDDDDGSQLGIGLLINSKRVTSTDGSNKSFEMQHSGPGGGNDASESSFGGGSTDGGGNKGGKGGAQRKRRQVSDSESSFGGSDSGSEGSEVAARPNRQEEMLNAKRELLYQFARLEKKGVRVPKHYTMTSDLDEMRADYERLRRDVAVDASVRFQRRMLMACVSGIEFMNNKFDPFDVHLDGWSETVQDGVNEYDDIFEELHEKYHGKVKMAPELRLMMTLGGSAVWFHMSNSMFRSTMPGIDQIFKQNPDLKQQFMSATMRSMQGQQGQQGAPTHPPPKQNQQPNHGAGSVGGGLFGHLGNMMGGMFGGRGAPTGPTGPMNSPRPTGPSGPSTPRTRPSMRGPSDVDDIMSEINDENFSEMNDVLEIFSNASSASTGDGSLADVVSIDGDDMGQRQPRRGARRSTSRSAPRRRTLDLD